MELIKPFKPYLETRYEVVADRADLYAYFLELGVRLLKPGGRLGYICSSTFFRTGSGEPLRRYLNAKAEIESVVDFGDLQIFEGVTTYPTILTLRRRNGDGADEALRFLHVNELPDDLSKVFSTASQAMPRARLGSGSWRFENDRLDAIRKKMAAGRKTLAEVYGPPLYGIKTGLNEAFVLTRAQRDALVMKDSRSAELLKPFLVGENLRRWHVESDDLWLIYTPKNRVDIEEYPAIRDWLLPFRDKLEKRATKQNWWELQQAQAAYEPSFEAAKIVFPDMSQGPKFSLDTKGYFCGNTVYFYPHEDRGLEAYLNTKAFWFLLFGHAEALRGGKWRLRLFSNHLDAMPAASNPAESQLTRSALYANSAATERATTILAFLQRAADLRGGARLSDSFTRWPGLNFGKFLSELRRVHSVEIPVRERDEWERYFNARKAEVETLTARIGDAEAEINDRVYRLFDLSRDEISLVEEAIAGQY